MHNPDVRASNMFRSQLMNPSMQQSQLQPHTPLQKKCDAGSETNISPKSDMSSVSIVQAEPRVSLRVENDLENIISASVTVIVIIIMRRGSVVVSTSTWYAVVQGSILGPGMLY